MNKYVQSVHFQMCAGCKYNHKTDLRCVSCECYCFCEAHMNYCVQCKQAVCKECYKTDRCCLVRPWGEKEEQHLKKVYQNKLADVGDGGILVLEKQLNFGRLARKSKWTDLRQDYFDWSFLYYFEQLNPYAFPRNISLTSRCIPRISKYFKNEETRLKYFKFLEAVAMTHELIFCQIVVYSEDRDQIIAMMIDIIRESLRKLMILWSLRTFGEPLFECLKKRDLLDWDLIKGETASIGHVQGLKWIESNAMDVANNREHFRNLVRFSPVPVIEYLIVEKGMTIEFLCENSNMTLDLWKLIYRLKGLKEIQSKSSKIIFDFDHLRFLQSIGYTFDKKSFS